MARSEEQIISQDPIKVKIGGADYEIPLLKLNKSRLWKQEWWKAIYGSDKWKDTSAKIEQLQKDEATTEEIRDVLSMGFQSILIDQPEELITLVCSYLKYAGMSELTREKLEEIATEADIALLWEAINDVSFPLVTSLANTMKKHR